MQDRVAFDGPRRAGDALAVRRELHGGHAADALASLRRRDGVAVKDLDVASACVCRKGTRGCAPQVDDGGDRHARIDQVDRRRVGAVVVRHDRDAAARLHGVAVEIGPRRRGQHSAGPVVVGEDQRTLDGPGGEHDLGGAHLP
jgi:hypothetical protein